MRRPTAMAVVLLLFLPAIAESQKPIKWRTGREFRKHLELPFGVTWSGISLRMALHTMAQVQRTAVLIDRRVDPGQKLKLSFNEPLALALKRIAADRGLSVCLVGDLVYFGPPKVTDRLRTVVELRRKEVARLPRASRSKWMAKSAWKWEDLATPRQLIAELEKKGKVEILGADTMAHDLWTAADLPPLALVDRLSLVAIAFDKTVVFSQDGKSATLVPIPDDLVINRRAGLLPAVKKPLGKKPATSSLTRFTLTIKDQPIGPLVKTLGEQLNLEIRFDLEAIHKAGISLQKRVSFDLKDASLDELLEASLRSAGLTFERKGKVVVVRPGK